MAPSTSVDEFFSAHATSRPIFDRVHDLIREIGPVAVRVTKSQVAFRRRRGFAWAWIPARYLRGERPPLVLSIALRRRDRSPRWKEVVHPTPRLFMHHLELRSAADVDAQVREWLAEAWNSAA
jgi:hypothetical protein